MHTILQHDNPVLREKAREVPQKDIRSANIQRVLADMWNALLSQDDGVAIAAPQIGAPLRMFLVAAIALSPPPKQDERTPTQLLKEKKEKGYIAFINPRIVKLSKEKATLDEGCLSVRPLYGKVRRAKKATITAYDEHGKKFTRGASGLLAQIFQHETDHLEGILFIDKATDLRRLPASP